jgi:hypothetical protein
VHRLGVPPDPGDALLDAPGTPYPLAGDRTDQPLIAGRVAEVGRQAGGRRRLGQEEHSTRAGKSLGEPGHLALGGELFAVEPGVQHVNVDVEGVGEVLVGAPVLVHVLTVAQGADVGIAHGADVPGMLICRVTASSSG